ncbi:MAG: hypothetical protein IB616_04615 [Methanosarcinales archaeon]|nr:MAG: hypothetical protein IB616_04615 [Methanosarcinales archaeon]
MSVLPVGIHPAEIVFTLLFAWAAWLFATVREQKREKGGIEDGHRLFLVIGLVLWTLASFLDVLDNLPASGIRILDICEHWIFLIGAIACVIGLSKVCKKYEELIKRRR